MQDISSYINLCGLQGLQRKGNSWNFRCSICGDSKKSKHKKRGWVIWNSKNSCWVYYCHNCGASLSFINYLKQYHNESFKDFIKNEFRNKYKKKEKEIKILEKKPIPAIYKGEFDLTRISELSQTHDAYMYMKNRKIPQKYFSYFGYTDNFKEWINTKINDKFKETKRDDRRIVVPFIDNNNICFGVAGRALSENNFPKYITIKFNEEMPKVFGLDRIDTGIDVYIFEGQIDSLFIPNSIALGGSDIKFDTIDKIIPKDKSIFIFDNEINFQIFKKIERVIDKGYKVCLLPKNIRKHGKDINDYIMYGMTSNEILDIIKKNTFFGLRAKAQFSVWKRR